MPFIFLAAFLLIIAQSMAVEVTYKGDMTVDYFGVFSDEASDSNSTHNAHHDFELEARIGLDEGMSATFGLASTSDINGQQSVGPRGYRSIGTYADDLDGKANELDLADAYASWEFTPGASFQFGRWQHAAGSINTYRPYRRNVFYSPIFKERTVGLGFGVKAADFFGYLGAAGDSYDTYNLYLSYDAPLLNSRTQTLNVQPIVDFRINDSDTRKWHFGLDNDYSSSWNSIEYSIHNVVGYMAHFDESTWNLLLEPTFKYQGFSLGLGYYYASLATHPPADTSNVNYEKNLARNGVYKQTDMPVQEFYYLEPYIPVSQKWAIGIPISRHDPNLFAKDDEFWEYGVTTYVYPTSTAQFGLQLGFQDYASDPVHFMVEFYSELRF